MGGSLSTIRWTPYGPLPDNRRGHPHPQHPLRKSKSYPPASPSNSTSNLSTEHDYETDDDVYNEYGHHHGTSGILMGANAPPLYDACLVGRWAEVLEICGGEEGSNDASNDSPTTATTRGSTDGGSRETPTARAEGETNNDDGSGGSTGHPCLQTRYADRRRNTPLHLACRRQPPPAVVRALLNHSPCEAVSRRTADGLTPLHFAAYCGAGVEVVSMLVDRMRSDAAVGRATRLSSNITLDENEASDENEHEGERGRLPSEESLLPPTRLLDRRQRTPLHCALSGFRTPIRPLVVRKLLAVDPASATLGDERGRTPLSLLFDDYAEEVMEALEEDVGPGDARERVKKGGELHECWTMLEMLLRAAYRGSVREDDEGDEGGSKRPFQQGVSGSISELGAAAEDRHAPLAKEVDLEQYEHERFSIVHAAAGVWECPAPLAKLVLKCMCHDSSTQGNDDLGPTIEGNDESEDVAETANDMVERDQIRQPDEETMRLPLHIAVCARPHDREGYSARLKGWLASPEARSATDMTPTRRSSQSSVASDTGSLLTHPDRGRSAGRRPPTGSAGRVYNPRFGRSPSRDSVVAYSSSQKRRGYSLSASSSSISVTSAQLAREPFLRHTMVRDVLELYPDAASVVDDRTGKLPIVLAIEHGKSWETAVGPLLDAYPTPFGGGGDGGMALPDGSDEGKAHRDALQGALFLALSSPEMHVREEAVRTAGKLARWGGVWGVDGSLDGIVGEWLEYLRLDTHAGVAGAPSPQDVPPAVVGPFAHSVGASANEWIQTQSSHLTAVAEVVSHARTGAISDRVARSCLDTSREYLFSRDGSVREAAARVLGHTLNSLGDADDAANVMREVVLNITDEEGSACGSVKSGRSERKEDIVAKHGRLLACHSILLTQWGSLLMSTPDISDATLALIHRSVKDKSPVVRSAAYVATGPILGKGSASSLKELRSDVLKGTRASELAEVQMSLAKGLTSASRTSPDLFLCRPGMPIMDAALMLAMSASSARPAVQKAFQIFLYVTLRMGRSGGEDDAMEDEESRVGSCAGGSVNGTPVVSPSLERYMSLAEGENGKIMMKFVTQTLAKIEDLDTVC